MPSEMKCPASIIVTNIRSSNRNLKQYVNYISQLNITWTFIGITENWGKPHTICHMHIPCYNHIYDQGPHSFSIFELKTFLKTFFTTLTTYCEKFAIFLRKLKIH